jgi:hypothetical protein
MFFLVDTLTADTADTDSFIEIAQSFRTLYPTSNRKPAMRGSVRWVESEFNLFEWEQVRRKI